MSRAVPRTMARARTDLQAYKRIQFVFLSFVFLIEHIRLVEKYSEEVNSALEKLGKEDGWKSWRKEESLRWTSRISTVIMIILIFI